MLEHLKLYEFTGVQVKVGAHCKPMCQVLACVEGDHPPVRKPLCHGITSSPFPISCPHS